MSLRNKKKQVRKVGQNSGMSHTESEQRLDVRGKTEMFTASVMWKFTEKSTETKGLTTLLHQTVTEFIKLHDLFCTCISGFP